ncbi:WbqC family protein [Paenibacillus lautus]|uniref:WbqC family protein n=1 Tax=Paenibacillus lautus TaxID=1401 RepID=UPI001C10E188|nr:WbqC family protein [Paenibacillus lautus]MBU5350610.1 WbqC family protein [Paenibacillus lautus]
MSKRICVYQPNVFPPLHYFNRIMNSDVWVMLDDVQLNKKVGQTRFSLKINGCEHLFTIPIPGGNRVKINAASIAYHHDWIHRLQSTLHHAYRKTPYFETVWSAAIDYIHHHQILNSSFQMFCEQFTLDMLRKLGWYGEIISSAGLATEFKASERIAEIVSNLEGSQYIGGGIGFELYVDLDHFRSRNLSIIVQDWKCPEYPQGKGNFVGNLSILDLISNVSLDDAKELLLAGGTSGWKRYE